MGIATRHISPQIALSAVLFIGLAAIAYHALNDQLLKAFLVVLIPIAIIYIILSIKRPLIALITYGTLCYFWGVIYRTFIRVNGISILLDIGMLFFLFCMILHSPYSKDIKWRRSFNVVTVAYAIWFVFCFLEIVNPNGLTEAWVNSRAMYPATLIFIILLTAFFTRFKLVKALIMIIAIFTTISFIKLMIQRYIGWDQYETTWLYSSESYRTHLLRTGIRYFSTFTDAGNHGSNMGNIALVYSIIFFYTKGEKIRWFYLAIAIMGVIGLFMSGTRGAMIVPLGGLVLFCLINKSIKFTLASAIVGIGIYIFFAFTYIGESNAMISRMRTAFKPTQDASFNVHERQAVRRGNRIGRSRSAEIWKPIYHNLPGRFILCQNMGTNRHCGTYIAYCRIINLSVLGMLSHHVQSEEYRISRYTYRFYMRNIWINFKCIRKSVFRTAQ